MITLWATLLVVVNLVWLALVVMQLPGNWLMVLTTLLVAWWQWDQQMFTMAPLAAIVALAALGEVLELFAGMAGAKRAGGGRWTSVAVLLGAIAGAIAGTFLIPIPIVGSLIGACGGACVGACGFELLGGRGHGTAIRIGVGAGIGQLMGSLSKLACGVAIWVIIAVAAYWP